MSGGDSLDLAVALLASGDHPQAAQACRDALADPSLEAPLRAEASSLLGLALLPSDPEAALPPLREAVALDPAEPMFRFNLGQGLEKAEDWQGAYEQFGEAIARGGGEPQVVFAHARAASRLGKHRETAQALAPLVAMDTVPRPVARLQATTLRTLGDNYEALVAAQHLIPGAGATFDEQVSEDLHFVLSLSLAVFEYNMAEAIARNLIAADPADARAALALATVRHWRGDARGARTALESALDDDNAPAPVLASYLVRHDDAKARLLAEARRQAEDEDVPDGDRSALHLALAQYRSREGDAGAAIAHALKGHALGVPDEHYGVAALREVFEANVRFARENDELSPSGETPRLLYIVGMPRSGGSLVQSVLAAGPGCSSVGERAALLPYLVDDPDALSALSAEERAARFAQLRDADLRGMARQAGEAKLVVDKAPHAMFAAGGIAAIHPGARFLCPLRDPQAIALSIWLRRFPARFGYAHAIGTILDAVELQLEALERWQSLGLDMRVLDFEAFARDPEVEARGLFEWLGLDFEPACLEPESRSQPVPTYSAAQVRQPIRPAPMPEGYSELFAGHAATLTRLRERQEALLAKG
ncbi:sulfotransferase [Novosphingobium marinum]|uniref:Tetratricopeptide (TPR) repeat protein n=1 Tax=Novosphingobium marinum TaxID=1514948 RepID=A0A7Y9XXL3_9SPHN|nr:sulfotransferase [Novosphingobium marinum]NYH96459.1 tetratricopeptide (TPR) repeat protein [Novosphingobium marinum]GGC35401.1 sulfotransferase [Novosphingobium marinum]